MLHAIVPNITSYFGIRYVAKRRYVNIAETCDSHIDDYIESAVFDMVIIIITN